MHINTQTHYTHTQKLNSLGVNNSSEPFNPDSVIFNFSSVTLSPRLKIILAYGLDFCLPIFKLDFYRYFLSYEKLSAGLSRFNCINTSELKHNFTL